MSESSKVPIEQSDKEYWQRIIAQSDAAWQPHLDKVLAIMDRHPFVYHFLRDGNRTLSGIHPEAQFGAFERHFTENQTIFNETIYHRETKGHRFVHFTSLQACIEILHSGNLRMYNPNYGNDPNEVIYAGGRVFVNELAAQYKTNELFTISLCDEAVLEDLLMWRFYGSNGAGVALIFEFENAEENWANWYFGKVQYGETDEYRQLEEFHNQMELEFGKDKTPKIILDLLPLYAFHKSKLFRPESENRLLFRNRIIGGQHTDCDKIWHHINTSAYGVSVSKVLTQDFRESYFCTYPLFWPQTDAVLQESAPYYYKHGPQIRLKGIELGFRYHEDDAAKMNLWLHTELWDRYPMDIPMRSKYPEVTVSKLKGAFR